MLRQIDAIGRWPHGHLDANMAMIPWIALRMITVPFPSSQSSVAFGLRFVWVPESVSGASISVSSVDAGHSAIIDMEEVLSNICEIISTFVADVVMSSDTGP